MGRVSRWQNAMETQRELVYQQQGERCDDMFRAPFRTAGLPAESPRADTKRIALLKGSCYHGNRVPDRLTGQARGHTGSRIQRAPAGAAPGAARAPLGAKSRNQSGRAAAFVHPSDKPK